MTLPTKNEYIKSKLAQGIEEKIALLSYNTLIKYYYTQLKVEVEKCTGDYNEAIRLMDAYNVLLSLVDEIKESDEEESPSIDPLFILKACQNLQKNTLTKDDDLESLKDLFKHLLGDLTEEKKDGIIQNFNTTFSSTTLTFATYYPTKQKRKFR